ncbi:MAG: hypothetical protein WCS31_12975 [Verrucomicrobiae bacterium]
MKTLIAVLLAGSCLAWGGTYGDDAVSERIAVREAGERLAAAAPARRSDDQQEYTFRSRDGEVLKIMLPVGLGIQDISIKTEGGRVVHGTIY